MNNSILTKKKSKGVSTIIVFLIFLVLLGISYTLISSNSNLINLDALSKSVSIPAIVFLIAIAIVSRGISMFIGFPTALIFITVLAVVVALGFMQLSWIITILAVVIAIAEILGVI